MDSSVSIMGITKFMFLIFLFNMGLSKQASLTDVPTNLTLEEELLQYTTEVVTSNPNERISETVCRVYRSDFPPIREIIFGGEDAKPGSIPHMGALGWRSKLDSMWIFKCGGSLISAKFLVTAGHCSWLSLRAHFDVVKNEPEIVRLGVEDILGPYTDELSKTPTDKKIERIIKHPNYQPPKKYFDIALIELEDEVIFSIDLHPACLWTKPGLFDNDSPLVLSGWGVTENGTPSSYLQVAYVDSLSTVLCDTLLMKFRDRNWRGFADHQMCAGKLAGKVDTCQGDSGGPIQQNLPDSTLYYVIGVTSFGVGCGKENQPGVYTRIYSLLDWIEENVWKDGY